MKKNIWLNVLFVAVAIAIVSFLLKAPEKSTTTLPRDANHKRFYDMPKKEAEQFCLDCHSDAGGYPLPKEHPPTYRCIMCHSKG